MRARADGPREPLAVDVAHVGHGPAARAEEGAELLDGAARPRGGEAGVAIDGDHALQAGEGEEEAAGRAERNERVSGGGDANGLAGTRGRAHEVGDLGFRRRSGEEGRPAGDRDALAKNPAHGQRAGFSRDMAPSVSSGGRRDAVNGRVAVFRCRVTHACRVES